MCKQEGGGVAGAVPGRLCAAVECCQLRICRAAAGGSVTARARNMVPFGPAGLLLCSVYELIFPLWVLAPSPVTSPASPAQRDPDMCGGSHRGAGDRHLPVLGTVTEFLLLVVLSKSAQEGAILESGESFLTCSTAFVLRTPPGGGDGVFPLTVQTKDLRGSQCCEHGLVLSSIQGPPKGKLCASWG